MNIRPYLLLLLLSLTAFSCKDKNTQKVRLELPITIKIGYGQFSNGYGEVNDKFPKDNVWGETYFDVKGVPNFLSNVAKNRLWTDPYQFAYQNFNEGKLTRSFYNDLQNAWKWNPDTMLLSKQPVRCYVNVVKGYDERLNRWAVMVDTNNNLDFGDETVYYPKPITMGKEDTIALKPIIFQGDIYRGGQRYIQNYPLAFRMMGNTLVYNFPQYGVALFERNSKRTELYISSKFFYPNFLEYADIGTAETPLAHGKFDYKKLTAIGEAIEIDGILYKNNGVDQRTNTLRLESIEPDELSYSMREGGAFYPFSSNDFSSKKPISLENYKGKYVYVDFWETTCKPCVEAMPKINQLYDSLDKSKVAFIGIVNNSPDQLKRFLAMRKLTWPQLIADSSNKLIEKYSITYYPTTMLIDPDGKVAIKDVSIPELRAKLHKLNLYK